MNELLLVILAGAGSGIVAALITVAASRRKNTAEIANIIADTETKRVQTLSAMQDEINELREQNKQLFVGKTTEVEAKEKLSTRMNRVQETLEMLRRELQTERENKLLMGSEILKLRDVNERREKIIMDQTLRIEQLEVIIKAQGATIAAYGKDITSIKKQTGSLDAAIANRK